MWHSQFECISLFFLIGDLVKVWFSIFPPSRTQLQSTHSGLFQCCQYCNRGIGSSEFRPDSEPIPSGTIEKFLLNKRLYSFLMKPSYILTLFVEKYNKKNKIVAVNSCVVQRGSMIQRYCTRFPVVRFRKLVQYRQH